MIRLLEDCGIRLWPVRSQSHRLGRLSPSANVRFGISRHSAMSAQYPLYPLQADIDRRNEHVLELPNVNPGVCPACRPVGVWEVGSRSPRKRGA
jgi:hypothetical protein